MQKQLSKSDITKLNTEIAEQCNVADFFNKKDRIILTEIKEILVVVKDKVPLFFYEGGSLVPTLRLLLKQSVLKQVVVDMGAVKFMTSGADVMRPGITEVDPAIVKDELVVIVDETHKKPLCVGKALFSGEEIAQMEKGKVLKNVHFVGDDIWKTEF